MCGTGPTTLPTARGPGQGDPTCPGRPFFTWPDAASLADFESYSKSRSIQNPVSTALRNRQQHPNTPHTRQQNDRNAKRINQND
jgi:hypothetical protein